MRKWRVEDSAELYNIHGWGINYFSINEKGNVIVTPRPGSASVDLKDLIDELQLRDVSAPVLLRFIFTPDFVRMFTFATIGKSYTITTILIINLFNCIFFA